MPGGVASHLSAMAGVRNGVEKPIDGAVTRGWSAASTVRGVQSRGRITIAQQLFEYEALNIAQ